MPFAITEDRRQTTDQVGVCLLSFDLSAPTDDAANMRWAREAWADMQRYGSCRMYLNFPGHGEDDDLVRLALGGEAYAHLAKVKRAYDPKT